MRPPNIYISLERSQSQDGSQGALDPLSSATFSPPGGEIQKITNIAYGVSFERIFDKDFEYHVILTLTLDPHPHPRVKISKFLNNGMWGVI
jgi:hypothetical protein